MPLTGGFSSIRRADAIFAAPIRAGASSICPISAGAIAAGAVLIAAVLSAACSEPLEFADWTIAVADGVEVFGYPPVLPSDREGSEIELVEDLVIRSRGEDARYLLYGPRDVDVGPGGRIFVLDDGYKHVKLYDAGGEHLRTFSGEGEGPGELSRPVAATVAGDRYVINDGGVRLSVWSLGGDYIDDVHLPIRPQSRPFVGLDDGSIVISFLRGRGDNILQSSQEGALRLVFGRLHPGDGEPHEYAEFAERIILMGRGPSGFDTPLRSYQRSLAVSPDSAGPSSLAGSPDAAGSRDDAGSTGDRLYLTNGDEYQVLSLDAAGSQRWALRVAQPRQPFSDEEVDYFLGQVRETEPDAMRTELNFAALANTLDVLQVDGHGHLWVFLQTFVHPDEEPQNRPVDVFSPQGEKLFSGYVPVPGWRAAQGDFIYRLAYDLELGEQTIVRYRLVEPFDNRGSR